MTTTATATTTAALLAAGALAGAGCGDLQGFGGPTPPLATFQVVVSGDVAAARPQVALVWGAQWLSEPFCNQDPPESTDVANVIAAGCRDSFGFVPFRVGPAVSIEVGVPAPISLYALPTPDLLIGDVSSRVAYASLVLYDDVNGDGTLTLATPHRAPGGGGPGNGNGMPEDEVDSFDVVLGASFSNMTLPDQRLAYLEGTFERAAFYPRAGCDDPPDGFSLLAAGGFSHADGIASVKASVATMMTVLPQEDPATCNQTKLPDPNATIQVPLPAPADVEETGCQELFFDGIPTYRRPPADPPVDLDQRVMACATGPSLGPTVTSRPQQLVVSGRVTGRVGGAPPDLCKGLTHYSLRGCRENVACAVPDWDYTANPPSWWPCAP
jgi:hypothetical protein